MNVLIASASLNSVIPDYIKERVLEHLPPFIIHSLARKKKLADKSASLLGKCLLAMCLETNNLPVTLLQSILKDQNNRLYFSNNGLYDFNISHSGKFVVCAFVENAGVGIDLEQIVPFDISTVSSVLSSSHQRCVENAENPLNEFYSIWTKCESILKADGRGLTVSPAEVALCGNCGMLGKTSYYLFSVIINPHYTCTLALLKKNCTINHLKPFDKNDSL